MTTTKRAIILFIMAGILFMAWGVILHLLGVTMAPAALLLTAGGVISVASAAAWWRLWRSIVSGRMLPAVIMQFAVTFTVVMLAVPGLNYVTADFDRAADIDGRVTSVYSEERHRTRRVGRRTYADGGTYHVYFANVEVPGVRRIKYPLTASAFRRVRRGTVIPVKVTTGCFGMKVIKVNFSQKGN